MRPRLITIPISHFCEKARWALDRAGIDFVEEPHIQAVHVWHARRAGGGRTVPVLVTGDEVLGDSSAILEWVDRRDPAPGSTRSRWPAEVRRIEDWLDEGLGPDGRLWMYDSTLPVLARHAALGARRDAALGAALLRRLRLGAGSGRSAATWASIRAASRAALESVDGVFDDVAGMLGDGRPYLCGERFTAADLTFGALSASVLVPPGYGSPLPPLAVMPPTMRREIVRLREHPAGRFAARLYAEDRGSARTAA